MTTVRTKFRPAPARGRAANQAAPSQPAGASRLAGQLALAHHIERLVESGELRDHASAASTLGVTRARMSQVCSLLLLAPEIQDRIAVGEIAVSERDLRRVSAEPEWAKQIVLLEDRP